MNLVSDDYAGQELCHGKTRGNWLNSFRIVFVLSMDVGERRQGTGAHLGGRAQD